MTTAAHHDPYILPMPTPDTPVVLPHLALPMHAHINGRYADWIWPLAALTENPSRNKASIRWRQCPVAFRDELRLVAWTMINGELRPTYLAERATRLRARISLSDLTEAVRQWMYLAAWLEERGLTSLAQCTTAVWTAYDQHLLAAGSSRERVLDILGTLTRLWAFDQLSARPAGVSRPPWDELGADDYLPAASSAGGGENTSEPIAEATMGPLLVWALRMVDDLADDILAGHTDTKRLAETGRTIPSTSAGQAALDAYLDPLVAARAPLPAVRLKGREGYGFARYYVGGLTGASRHQVALYVARHGLVAAAAQRPGPCPLPTPITGRIAGRPWREALDFGETPGLIRLLVTACFIVIAYLTGMQPGEVLGLRHGCCPDPEPDASGRIGRHLIYGHEYKNATDAHGNHHSAGRERDVPWVAITPVVHAVRALERMVECGELLFAHAVHGAMAGPSTGSLRSPALRVRIEDFVTWANAEAARHRVPGEVIPPDPHGAVGTRRFRRTLAWHVARRPGGLVALAIQYGHLRTALVSEGYAARSRDGIHELIDIETVRAVADTVADLNDDLQSGGGLSGPAARRAIKATARAPRFEGTVINATTARRLLANDDAMLYDNPQALLLCHYKREQALCHRTGVRDSPRLDHCMPGCGNIVRTDHHATSLRDRADTLDRQATHVPQPISERLRDHADRLRGIADTHDRTRITLKDPTP